MISKVREEGWKGGKLRSPVVGNHGNSLVQMSKNATKKKSEE